MSGDDFLGYVKTDHPGWQHEDGQQCWLTDQGCWVRDGEGTYSDAECPLGHENTDPVALPPHYRHLPVECIDVTEHFNFCMGNAIKYIWRADHKGKPVEDIAKAIWYLQRELGRREREAR